MVPGQKNIILRYTLIMFIMALLAIAIIAKAAIIMFAERQYWKDVADRFIKENVIVHPTRGNIISADGKLMASSLPEYKIYMDFKAGGEKKDTMLMNHLTEICEGLHQIFPDKSAKEFRQHILKGRRQKSRNYLLYPRRISYIEYKEAKKLPVFNLSKFKGGFHELAFNQRKKPFGSLAARTLGDMYPDVALGAKNGIELTYDSILKGQDGITHRQKVMNKYLNIVDKPAVDGCDIITTIDVDMQDIAEKALVDQLKNLEAVFGVAIVMDVATGEVKANVNMTRAGDGNYYEMRNIAVSNLMEPGSTFKVLTMSAALDCGAIDLNTPFHCSGSEQIPGRAQRLHCWRSTGHGAEKTPQALQNSCNIAFAHIALKLGGERFYEYVKNFGVLEKTGIDLAGESKGVFFDKALVTDTDKWGTASLTSGSFGQTFKITPLQLVRAISSVVNGGQLMEPYIVSEILDADGNTVMKAEPTVVRRTISQETSDTMRTLIESVVTEGTAKNAKVAGFSIGGKTGTSEKIDVFDENGQRVQDKIVSFVGIAPMDDPEYIILAALDTPSRTTGIYISGGVMAAPTVGAVMADVLPYLGVKQSFSEDDIAGKLIVMEDLTGMTAKDAQTLLKKEGLTAAISGSGETVTGQIPSPGQTVPGGSQVLLFLGQTPEPETVKVPDFYGMNRQQASDAAGALGLYILVTGNDEISTGVTVTAQNVAKDTGVPAGTTITLVFADTAARD